MFQVKADDLKFTASFQYILAFTAFQSLIVISNLILSIDQIFYCTETTYNNEFDVRTSGNKESGANEGWLERARTGHSLLLSVVWLLLYSLCVLWHRDDAFS